jgi:hypothetical protein
MIRRRRKPAHRLAAQAIELSVAAPHVVARRMSRLAQAGLQPNARDRRELLLMSSEKMLAFYQSWAAAWTHVWRAQLEAQRAFATAALDAAIGRRSRRSSPSSQDRGARLLSAMLHPVHRAAVANSKRLSRRRS